MNKTLSTLIGVSALATGLLTFAPSQAQAAACQVGGITSTSGFSLIGSPVCYGQTPGNDNNTALNGYWGSSNWNQIAKQDTPGGLSGTGTILINGSTNNSNPGKSGTWSYDNFIGGMRYALVVKGGPNFSTYDFVANATTGSGNWNNALAGLVNNGGKVPDLSHFSIYKDNTSTPVPEPLTLLGSGIALGFGGFLKRKAKQDKQG